MKGPVTMMGHSTGGMLAAPQALQPKLENYRELAQKTARAIPKAVMPSEITIAVSTIAKGSGSAISQGRSAPMRRIGRLPPTAW